VCGCTTLTSAQYTLHMEGMDEKKLAKMARGFEHHQQQQVMQAADFGGMPMCLSIGWV
jgi:hypothetical protein